MKYTVGDFAEKFLYLLGDESFNLSEPFIVEGLNWSFNELPRVPKLGKLFSKHVTANLDAEEHYKWDLSEGSNFRRLSDLAYISFYTSGGGKPCPLSLCNKDTVTFFKRNGLPELKEKGIPCEYTLEVEGDKVWLVFDRPLNTPMIVDYIAFGYPKPVRSFEDEIELSAIAENLVIGLMRSVVAYEGLDFSWGSDVLEYLDNKAIREAIYQLNHRFNTEMPVLLGEQ